MWRWSTDGTLRLFRTRTGFEIFRCALGPVDAVPAPTAWRVLRAWHEGDHLRYEPHRPPEVDLALLLLDVGSLHAGQVTDLPVSRADAHRRTAFHGQTHHQAALHLLAEQWNWQLPARASSMAVRYRSVEVDNRARLLHVHADGDALRIDFDDDTVLWLQQPVELTVSRGMVRMAGGGVALWPAQDYSATTWFRRSALQLPGSGRRARWSAWSTCPATTTTPWYSLRSSRGGHCPPSRSRSTVARPAGATVRRPSR